MSRRSDREFLQDIQEAVRRIAEYISGMTYEDFLKDSKTQDAVIRNLEIIGEATKNLSREIRAAHPDIPWRARWQVSEIVSSTITSASTWTSFGKSSPSSCQR